MRSKWLKLVLVLIWAADSCVFAQDSTFCQSAAKAVPDRTLCRGSSLQLNTQPVSGLIYFWKAVGTLTCTRCSSPFVFPDSSVHYFVSVSDPSGSCVHTDTVTVTVLPQSKADFSFSNIDSLTSQNFTFVNRSENANLFIWQFGEGTSGEGRNPEHHYKLADTTLAVRLIAYNSEPSCPDTNTQLIYLKDSFSIPEKIELKQGQAIFAKGISNTFWRIRLYNLYGQMVYTGPAAPSSVARTALLNKSLYRYELYNGFFTRYRSGVLWLE